MTEKDLIIEEQRRTIKRLETELRDAKAMLHRLSKFVSDEAMAQIVIDMTPKAKPTITDAEEFWRGE